jgi:4-hydroxy-3-methylbut-2-en-1-yl diphosphate reductase
MQILLANPRGFCAGVDRAIEIVERVLALFGPPVYVHHEVVHNRFVVERLQGMGAIFVEGLGKVPDQATLVFSAHGVSRRVQREAEARGFRVFDATCPLVTKVHLEVIRHAKLGHDVVLIGHAGHPEVEGTMGRYDASAGGSIHLVENEQDVACLKVRDPQHLGYVTQTTLSMDDARVIIGALKRRFPKIAGARKEDICYATQNRQDAVKALSEQSDLVLVVGSANSSNSNRLREVAERRGTPAFLIDSADDIRDEWLEGVDVLGITAGASAPEVLVDGVIERLRRAGVERVGEMAGRVESVSFKLPRELERS